MSHSKIFDLDTFLSNLPKSRYFIDVMDTPTMAVGINKLEERPGRYSTASYLR